MSTENENAENLPEADIERARELVAEASRIAILTGAGVSAESGVPTFRGGGGLWRQYDVTRVATTEAFLADPKLVWEFYNERRAGIAKVKPNPAHYAIAELQKRRPETTLITQNIDNLHRDAGSPEPIELHGNVWKVRCSGCHAVTLEKRMPMPVPPECECGAFLRPHVVWFGESLDPAIIDAAAIAAGSCDLFISVGTSAVVYPAAALPLMARERGAKLIEVNVEPTDLSYYCDAAVFAPAGKALPRILAAD